MTEMTDQEKTPTEPIEETSTDDDEMEIEISERKLLWTVVAVLAVFAVVEGLTIVSWGSRIRRLEQQIQSPSVALAGGGGDRGAPPMHTQAGPPDGGGPIDGDSPHIPVSVSPDEVRAMTMRAVDAFATEKSLDEATAEKLRTLIEDSERELESLPAKEAAGEITAEERIQTLEKEIARREQQARELLGDELATELLAKIVVGASGLAGPAGTPPGAPKK
jgi:hypothetical protein